MKNTKAAVRYATAILDTAIEKGNIDSVLGDMQFVLNLNNEEPAFRNLLSSPIIKPEEKIEVFQKIFSSFEENTKNLVFLMTKNQREVLLPEVADAFVALVKKHRGIVSATLVTATVLNDDVKNKIVSKIADKIEGALEVKEEVDPEIIGGFLMKVGDLHIDATVSNQLNNLKQKLIN